MLIMCVFIMIILLVSFDICFVDRFVFIGRLSDFDKFVFVVINDWYIVCRFVYGFSIVLLVSVVI